MISIFEIQNALPFEQTTFDKMKNTAADILSDSETSQYTQAVVLLTSNGNEFCSVINDALSIEKNDEKALVDKLICASDTKIDRILCLWHNGEIDIPSIAFRKMLYELNQENLSSGIFVTAKDGYSVIKLENTLK